MIISWIIWDRIRLDRMVAKANYILDPFRALIFRFKKYKNKRFNFIYGFYRLKIEYVVELSILSMIK